MHLQAAHLVHMRVWNNCITILGLRVYLQAVHLVQMATKLTRLEELVMSRCTSLTLNAVQGFPAMTSLDLSHCEGLQPAAAVSALPHNLFMWNSSRDTLLCPDADTPAP